MVSQGHFVPTNSSGSSSRIMIQWACSIPTTDRLDRTFLEPSNPFTMLHQILFLETPLWFSFLLSRLCPAERRQLHPLRGQHWVRVALAREAMLFRCLSFRDVQ